MSFSRRSAHRPQRYAFTLIEIMVSMAVLLLLLGLILQLFNSAYAVTTAGNKHMTADAQARALLDRLGVDISAMVKRSDVDYYLKGRPAANNQPGNDQLAFYSEVPGYSPSGVSTISPVSLVAYRVNSATQQLERLGKGLVWNGDSSANTPVVFLPIPLASPLPSPLPSPTPTITPTPAWPQAASSSITDTDYEVCGSQVFRFEYYYILKGQGVTTSPVKVSDTPWDTRAPLSHTSLNGWQDVAATTIVIAVIDPKSRLLVNDAQLSALAGQMIDFANTMAPGDLEKAWQNSISVSAIPKIVAQSIRVYSRTFYLDSPTH